MRFRLHYVHVITYDVTNVLMLLNRLHYGFEKFIYFCFQQKKIACIIEIMEKKLCHFFLSCTLCHFFLCHFFLVPFFPVPFFPVPFFPVPFFPTLGTAIRDFRHQRAVYLESLLLCHEFDSNCSLPCQCHLSQRQGVNASHAQPDCWP